MKQDIHFIQDACELYTVYLLQKISEEEGNAISSKSNILWSEYEVYLAERNLTHNDLSSNIYVKNLDAQLPVFHKNLKRKLPKEKFSFTNIETQARKEGLKGDFRIDFLHNNPINFSLKNYSGGIRNPQFKSGTFNSFILNFLFVPLQVGWFKDPNDGKKFRGSNKDERNQKIFDLGHQSIIPLIIRLDNLQADLRNTVLTSDEYKFYDEEKFDQLRKKVGTAGATIALEILNHIGEQKIRTQLIEMTGFAGGEELLAVSPTEYLDSYTSDNFHKFRRNLTNPLTRIEYELNGQTIVFQFILENENILSINVPFTINSNGAWYRDEPFEGVKFHPKEKMNLRYGQLRPKKSKEISTSINTYVNLGMAGLYSPNEV